METLAQFIKFSHNLLMKKMPYLREDENQPFLQLLGQVTHKERSFPVHQCFRLLYPVTSAQPAPLTG